MWFPLPSCHPSVAQLFLFSQADVNPLPGDQVVIQLTNDPSVCSSAPPLFPFLSRGCRQGFHSTSPFILADFSFPLPQPTSSPTRAPLFLGSTNPNNFFSFFRVPTAHVLEPSPQHLPYLPDLFFLVLFRCACNRLFPFNRMGRPCPNYAVMSAFPFLKGPA